MPTPDVTFVFPRVDNGTFFRGFDFNLGASYVRAYLQNTGKTTTQFVDFSGGSIEDATSKILAQRPKIVGFSCYDSNFFLCTLVAHSIKRRAPQTFVIIGGPSATFSSEKILAQHIEIDLAVRSYGEEATAEVIAALDAGGDFSEIPGVTWRSKVGTIISNKERALPTAGGRRTASSSRSEDVLDRFPDPYLSGILPIHRLSDIGMITSRGCSFPCTFCNFAAMSSRKVRDHSLTRVFQVLDHAEAWAASSELNPKKGFKISINDDNFSIDARRMREMLEGIVKRNYQYLTFWAEMRVDALDQPDFALLSRAGFSEMNIGLDTASVRIVRAAKKIPAKREQDQSFLREQAYLDAILRASRWTKAYDIDLCVSIILGLPFETRDDAEQTLSFVSSLQLSRYAHNYIQVFDGTELANTHSSAGIQVRAYPGRVLPNLTEPAYPVRDVPILKGDESQEPNRKLVIVQSLELISGQRISTLGHAQDPKSFGRGGETAQAASTSDGTVVLLSPTALTANSSSVFRNLPMKTSAWVFHRHARSKNGIRRRNSLLGLPMQDVNFLQLKQTARKRQHFGFASLNRPAPSFGGTPLADFTLKDDSCSTSNQPGANSGTTPYKVLMASSGPQLAEVRRVMRSLQTGRGWIFDAKFLASPAIVADACRWSAQLCPAPNGKRLLFSKKCCVSPCFSHPTHKLSQGEILADAVGEFRDAYNEAYERRGCASCSARFECSHCFVTSELGAQFCKIKQEDKSLSNFIQATSLVARLINTNHVLPNTNLEILDLISIPDGGSVSVGSARIELNKSLLLLDHGSDFSVLYIPTMDFVATIERSIANQIALAFLPPLRTRVASPAHVAVR